LIRKAVTVKSPETMVGYTGATTEFPPYNMTQMLYHRRARTPSQPRHHPEVPEMGTQFRVDLTHVLIGLSSTGTQYTEDTDSGP